MLNSKLSNRKTVSNSRCHNCNNDRNNSLGNNTHNHITSFTISISTHSHLSNNSNTRFTAQHSHNSNSSSNSFWRLEIPIAAPTPQGSKSGNDDTLNLSLGVDGYSAKEQLEQRLDFVN